MSQKYQQLKSMTNSELTYSEALGELKELIAKIEKDDPDVDDMSKMVKRATELILFCREKLVNTEEQLAEAMKKLEE